MSEPIPALLALPPYRPAPRWQEHASPSSAALAQSLAETVAAHLRAALAARGTASVAVSGGKTPLQFFDCLSRQKLDWSKVAVTLADERWVPATSERSNTRLVYQHLLVNEATSARFVPLYVDAPDPQSGLARIDLSALPLPLDICILGMGDDGHTASWFPSGDHLAEALDPAGRALLLPMHAPGAPEPRITFTAPVLLNARALILHSEGEAKRAVFTQACADGPLEAMPIRAALRAARQDPIQLYWCV